MKILIGSKEELTLTLEVAQIVLYHQGFEKFFAGLAYTSPGLRNKIIERMDAASGNFYKILDWREWVEALMGV